MHYLRTLATSGGRFSSYAQAKLISIDRDILAAYRAQAQAEWNAKHWTAARAALQTIIDEYPDTTAAEQAKVDLRKVIVAQYSDEAAIYLAAHDYDNAKASYRKIIAEFPDGDEAAWADGELRKIVPTAVVYYKTVADTNFHPEAKGQFGVPQTKAAEFYEKMYKEDPDGPQADTALYYWSRALGTEGKIQDALGHLQEFAAKYPDSPVRPQALFALGFMYGNKSVKNYDAAIKTMREIAEKSPNSQQAPDALFHIAFFYAWRGDFKDGLPYLEKLVENYPSSPRAKWAAKWIVKFKEKIQSGGQWP